MTDQPAATPYRVLARKYRPGRFADLIGQEAMVRTLTNAIRSDRLAHAFMLTGVRGVGKTSTARIIARALNCVGPDGTGGPTPDPCGVCEHCVAIAEDRHMDVLELDAASRTKVEEMRELLDGVRYRPSSARFKIYIIDEVHMLSGHSFNALLKTLEEPPEHVKFIFATTEIRKVPVTVLSRCQRFDLRRVDADLLVEHFGRVAAEEGATVEPEALRLIARAADGSVRDGLSLLDQAIAHGSGEDGAVTEAQVRAMLGLADGARRFDLLDAIMKGAPAEALSILEELYDSGADPVVVLQDLLELTHWITRLKVTPGAAQGPGVSEIERQRGTAMAEGLSMPVLTRAWQMLLKGLTETRTAPSPVQAAEMVLIRLTFAADLPAPAELVKKMADGDAPSAPRAAAAAASASSTNGGASAVATAPARGDSRPAEAATAPTASSSRAALALAPASEPAPSDAGGVATTGQAEPATFREVVDLFFANKEPILHAHLMKDVHLVRFEPGRIELRAGPHAPTELASKVMDRLNSWTGRRWMVSLSQAPGEATLSEQDAASAAARRDEALSHPLVRAAMEVFPGATVEEVREPEAPLQDVPAPPADDIDQESLNEDGNEVP